MSKPILYTFHLSVWSAVPEIAAVELGYGADAYEKKIIDVVEGGNFAPEFVKINPNATLPTLTVGGKTYTNTTDVTRYFVDNAPKKIPHGNAAIITRIHEDNIDPNFPLFAVRDEEALKAASSGFPLVFATNRVNALIKFSKTPEAESLKEFYEARIPFNSGLLAIYKGEATEEAKQAFFKQSQQLWQNVVNFILKELPELLPESGFISGATPGEDDFHVAAWLARIGLLTGANQNKGGYQSLEKELKEPVPAKVAAYWDAWTERPGWQQTYAAALR